MVTSTTFNGSADVYSWLSSFINLERGQHLKSFCLDRMKALSLLTGKPEECAPSIHVAGSKGKGSVTGMITAILEAAGIKTARYTSPHVIDFRERLTLGSKFFDEDTYGQAGKELKKLVESLPYSQMADLFDPRLDSGEAPSFFELLTLWFFLCARHAQVDAMAVETGLGGRLDATNILDPLVSVITLIELEHTEFLGTTIKAIAGEKAGIIKPSRPLILAEQTKEAHEVFVEHTSRLKSQLIYFPDHADIQDISLSQNGTTFSLILKNPLGTGTEKFDELFTPMPGVVQARNAGLSILAVKTAYPEISTESIRTGLASFRLPARFERISDRPPVVIDGAHTKNSMELCVNTFTSLYGKGAILIFGCAVGKDVSSMAETCIPFFSSIIITTPGTFKVSCPEEIYKIFSEEAKKKNNTQNILFTPDTASAIEKAIKLAEEFKLPILGTGSFYLAAEIRNNISS